jgi:hypothetical protein
MLRALVLGGVVLLAACGNDAAPERAADPTSIATPKSKLALNSVTSCSEFREYFADSLVRQILTEYLPCWGCEVIALGRPGVGAPVAFDGAAGPEAGSGGFEVSDTNVQEAGVDEADLVKADSRGYFYIARGQELLVVDAEPAEQINIVARLPVAGYARSLYLDETGQRLALMVDGAGPQYDGAPFPARYGAGLLFVDVADPAAPVITNWFWTEGYAVDSRRVDNRLHLVTRYAFSTPEPLRSGAEFQQLLNDYYVARSGGDQARIDQLAAQIEQRVRQVVAAAPLSELLPLQHSGLDGEPAPLDCGQVQRIELEQRLGLMVISSMDMDGAEPASLAVVNNAWRLYGSTENLYLLQDSGGWWFDRAQTQQTAIYRYVLTAGAVEPAGFGLVDGWVLNSYSLGEHDGFLRVATTESRFEPEGPWSVTNHLTVLGEAADGNLETVGAVRDFVRDERIFSARFLGDRGYIVTFLQIDPLFAFDLSDPRAPRLAGQIEIPGFATYLHPLGTDHLLTIGRAGNAGGFIPNIQLQIFDVSDLTQPALLHAYVPEVEPNDYVFSLAEYDPHAFTYFAPAELLSIPAQIGSGDPDRSFSGFMAFNVDLADGFTELGRIDHKSAEAGGTGCPSSVSNSDGTVAPGETEPDEPPSPECEDFAPVYYNWPLRSVVLSDSVRTVLYTLSDASIRAHDIADLSAELGSVSLAPAE